MTNNDQINDRSTFQQAKDLESTKANGDLLKAVFLYEKILKINPVHIHANNRLMVVYRKLGDHNKELKAIKNAIKAYQASMEKDRKDWISHNKVKTSDNTKFAQVMELIDAKGKPIYESEILSGWKNRLKLLHDRINKNKVIKSRSAG